MGNFGATDDIVRIKCEKRSNQLHEQVANYHADVHHLQQNVKRCKKQEEEKGSQKTFKVCCFITVKGCNDEAHAESI